jgi:hypothetical protein
MTTERTRQLIVAEEVLNDAIAAIQEKLGTDDGGFASVFFTGDNGERLQAAEELLADYIEAETIYLKDI